MTTAPVAGQVFHTREQADAWNSYYLKQIKKHYATADKVEQRNGHEVKFVETLFGAMAFAVRKQDHSIVLGVGIPNEMADKYKPDPSVFNLTRDSDETIISKNLSGPGEFMATMYPLLNMLAMTHDTRRAQNAARD